MESGLEIYHVTKYTCPECRVESVVYSVKTPDQPLPRIDDDFVKEVLASTKRTHELDSCKVKRAKN